MWRPCKPLNEKEMPELINKAIRSIAQAHRHSLAVVSELVAYAASAIKPSIFKDATLVASVHPFASTFQEH